MKALIISDLHLDFHKDPTTFVRKVVKLEPEVLIIAGDFGELIDPTVRTCLEYLVSNLPKIIYIIGNHECYNCYRKEVIEYLTGLGILYENLNDGIFAGTTTWFEEDPFTVIDKIHLNDFKYINELKENALEACNWNKESLEFWKECNAPIWIMHHAPSIQSCIRRDKLTKYYISRSMENIILERKPRVVIHGHLHNSVNYYIGDTHIVSNPYGYEGHKLNRDFGWLWLDTNTFEVWKDDTQSYRG